MKIAASIFAAALLLLATPGGAAGRPTVEFSPIACVRGGESPLLQVKVEGDGELRAYFRRVNSTDWCSVEGDNMGPLSRVVLPKFEQGEAIEYFFVLLDGNRVIARSQRIYRSAVTSDCEAPWARHVLRLALKCSEEAMPSALAAGYSIDDTYVDGDPPQQSPDRPTLSGQ